MKSVAEEFIFLNNSRIKRECPCGTKTALSNCSTSCLGLGSLQNHPQKKIGSTYKKGPKSLVDLVSFILVRVDDTVTEIYQI